jgi:hypothetical protein
MNECKDESFEHLMDYIYEYTRVSWEAECVTKTLQMYDNYSFLDKYHLGYALTSAIPPLALAALKKLEPKIKAQFILLQTQTQDASIPYPPSLDATWDESLRKWIS